VPSTRLSGIRFSTMRTLRLSCVFVCGTTTLIASDRPGQVRGLVVDEVGASVGHAAVELVPEDQKRAIQHTQTAEDGFFQFQRADAGGYLLKINAVGFREATLTGVRVFEDRETVVNDIRLKVRPCSDPGVNCDVFVADTVQRRCVIPKDAWHDDKGAVVTLQPEELTRRAIHSEPPSWPKGEDPGGIGVTVVIDPAGLVACAEALTPAPRAVQQAAVAAAKQWRFQPVLQHGRPVSAVGQLEFPSGEPK